MAFLLAPVLLRTAFFMTTSPFTLIPTVKVVEQTLCLQTGVSAGISPLNGASWRSFPKNA
jgi:hypothetical protein